ncbi:MAG TPA: nitrite reductase large subunit NirB [Burkholderiales bacterium]|jgi:nitrite reductase (NADH) large subunit|nr:nitrite reductase large subunit NirB [Burkholderiales bacterium]
MKLVVIGNGMVGQRFLEQVTARLPSDALDVTVFCEEPRAAYDRVQLTSFFAGKSAIDLSVVPARFFEERAITLRLNDRVVAIDRLRRNVSSGRYREVPYDKLVLATGSFPFVPPIPGRDRRGCFVYRSIEDLEVISAAARRARVGAVIGGGLLGLEAAKALTDLGLETHVVEFASRLMAVQLDEPAGQLLRRKIEALGVHVHSSKGTKEIVNGTDRSHRMVFSDGTTLETDLIVYSAGIRPHDELARAAELEIGARGGVVIDDHCRTSDPEIYAVGECALWKGRIYGLVAPGYQMAEVAARHLAGEADARFAGADMSTKLKLMGVDVASIGDALGATPGALDYVYSDPIAGIYKKLVVSSDGKSLRGAILLGDATDYGNLLQIALNGMPLPAHPEDLILPAREGGGKGLGVDLLPASALICSCNSVTKGGICDAVAAGATTLGALKKQTRASTTCGGCGPLVKQILDAELRKQGVDVKNHLCEHFLYSRQELFHLTRVGGLRTFDDIAAKHGQGRGCDICKPAVASILAACWNEYILRPKHAPLQDTNDHFLANLQKNGTYSIVPRVPGGEITPEKLIVLGEVARKFGLYTKITGAQRIDLFGARVEQLPLIWRDLVDAGFESGHAYGKALRTVKSCVGSTWCRYGVQDSVLMAINIENRYRGLRSPHKLKMAVSGCTRECAEAQGKDVGIIATEKGWNLYVCGNGGMKPRHADLLATDLDDRTLVRYIDRFLMFYIRTGDRLQRTSTWLENLEGGIDYVRQVVCEDSLGIGAELESDMQRLVDTYECEWKKAINDPETLKRFRHFVNSDEPDANVVFVAERGQIRPARPDERESALEAVES